MATFYKMQKSPSIEDGLSQFYMKLLKDLIYKIF